MAKTQRGIKNTNKYLRPSFSLCFRFFALSLELSFCVFLICILPLCVYNDYSVFSLFVFCFFVFRITVLLFYSFCFAGDGYIFLKEMHTYFETLTQFLKHRFVFYNFLFVFHGLRVLDYKISPTDVCLTSNFIKFIGNVRQPITSQNGLLMANPWPAVTWQLPTLKPGIASS